MGITLAELADRCQATLRGNPTHQIERVATLDAAGPQDLVFIASNRYLDQLTGLRAGAIILDEYAAQHCHGNLLISANPRLCYARAAALLHPPVRPMPGCHKSAVIDASAHIDPTATVDAQAVIEAGAIIGARTVIGAGAIVSRDSRIGVDCWLHAHVVVAERCVLGDRCIVQAGAVIGSDGFGFAQDGQRWEKTPQLGRVVIGDDVEIGANTTIDRGALGDTVIERGVKLDNLIQIAHNVIIGEDTAIAACVGIAGSTRIGKRCTLAGQVGVVGHIEIADDVHVTGATVVSRSIHEPGTYSSGSPLEPYQSWLKNAVRMRQLDDMARRLKKLEQKIAKHSEGGTIEEP